MFKLIARPPLASQTVRWYPRVYRGSGQVREHQPIFCEPHPPPGLPVTHDRRSHPGREVPGASDDERPDGAVPHGLVNAGTNILAAKVEAKSPLVHYAPYE